MTTTQGSKSAVIAALHAWINQRPGLEFGNYGEMKSYRAEIRQIGKDLQHARTLLRAVELRDSITGEMIVEAAKHAYSGRLSILVGPTEGERLDGIRAEQLPAVRIDYCTGQYWPTEYRRAVCAVLASVLWDYWRDNMPKEVHMYGHAKPGHIFDGASKRPQYLSAGDWLRNTAKREFGRSIGERWFN